MECVLLPLFNRRDRQYNNMEAGTCNRFVQFSEVSTSMKRDSMMLSVGSNFKEIANYLRPNYVIACVLLK